MDLSLANEPLFSEAALAEHTYAIQTMGYSIVENYLNPAFCTALKDKLISALNNYSHKNTAQAVYDQHHIHDLLAQDILFAKLLEDPRLQQLLSPFLNPYWILYAFTSSSIPPQGKNYGNRIHIDCPRFAREYIFNMGVIWALDDFTSMNGGTQVLPASQHYPVPPTEKYFEKNCAQITCRQGALIIFNARVFHRSGENKTQDWRHSLTMNACHPYMKQRMDWVRLIPASISDFLNQQARRIIGYDTRLPASLEEFFVPEEQRLYKVKQE
ncbi:MAG TPA: phytanoyl-CoA dioxygenase family protein [Gammaproteobacteria bacterium]|nr:phytanoyl-CoA dioxygenase family protein [Gammaproteobacteria bacterium]